MVWSAKPKMLLWIERGLNKADTRRRRKKKLRDCYVKVTFGAQVGTGQQNNKQITDKLVRRYIGFPFLCVRIIVQRESCYRAN